MKTTRTEDLLRTEIAVLESKLLLLGNIQKLQPADSKRANQMHDSLLSLRGALALLTKSGS